MEQSDHTIYLMKGSQNEIMPRCLQNVESYLYKRYMQHEKRLHQGKIDLVVERGPCHFNSRLTGSIRCPCSTGNGYFVASE